MPPISGDDTCPMFPSWEACLSPLWSGSLPTLAVVVELSWRRQIDLTNITLKPIPVSPRFTTTHLHVQHLLDCFYTRLSCTLKSLPLVVSPLVCTQPSVSLVFMTQHPGPAACFAFQLCCSLHTQSSTTWWLFCISGPHSLHP